LNRRKFLKYAGVTGVVVGGSALGLGYLLKPESRFQQVTTNQTLLTTTNTSLNSSTLSSTTSTSATTSIPSKLVELSFYSDPDLNGLKEASESRLSKLSIMVGGRTYVGDKVAIPPDSTVDLTIQGLSPVGKQLTTATYNEPRRPVALPTFRFHSGMTDGAIGLADGPATSPIKPSEMTIDDYEYFRLHPNEWAKQYLKYYPAGLPYEPNYFFYGALEPGSYGVPEGKPHLAFDIWATDGTPVHACWGGTIVPGLYDRKFGIDSGSQVAYYNHLVPSVKIGDTVQRYDLLGNIEKGLGHVHFELRPDPTAILNIFTTMSAEDLLKSPLRGEKVPQLPYFGKG
jgi:hypothetical protein